MCQWTCPMSRPVPGRGSVKTTSKWCNYILNRIQITRSDDNILLLSCFSAEAVQLHHSRSQYSCIDYWWKHRAWMSFELEGRRRIGVCVCACVHASGKLAAWGSWVLVVEECADLTHERFWLFPLSSAPCKKGNTWHGENRLFQQ